MVWDMLKMVDVLFKKTLKAHCRTCLPGLQIPKLFYCFLLMLYWLFSLETQLGHPLFLSKAPFLLCCSNSGDSFTDVGHYELTDIWTIEQWMCAAGSRPRSSVCSLLGELNWIIFLFFLHHLLRKIHLLCCRKGHF